MGLSEFLTKLFAGPKNRACEAGQAVVEYILVLVIIVSIILGILFQFNDAFKNFLQSYFGDYLACLLETGELPALGGGTGPTTGECTANFAGFSVASGKPLKPMPPAGGGAGGAGGIGTGAGAAGANAKGGAKGSGADSSASAAGVAGSGGRGRSGQSNAGTNGERTSMGSLSRPASQPLEQKGEGGQGDSVSGGGRESSDGFSIGGRRRRASRSSSVAIDEALVAESAKKKKDKTDFKGKVSRQQRAMAQLRSPQFIFNVPKAKDQLTMTEDKQGFSFGFLFKFLLIGGILIAIFIFLGGQAMQIKKSWQKSD